MKRRIVRIGPHQAGKVVGGLYVLVGLVVGAVTFATRGSWQGIRHFPVGAVLVVALPLLYGVVAYVLGFLAALTFNVIAKCLGGLEVTIESE
jgi:hypothetical protein